MSDDTPLSNPDGRPGNRRRSEVYRDRLSEALDDLKRDKAIADNGGIGRFRRQGDREDD
jgi:hypothetical protein